MTKPNSSAALRTILPGGTIGILGGGQLGRMTAMAAKQMGYRVVCLDPQPNSPCGQVCDAQIQGSFDDYTAARALAKQSDVCVYEFENINADVVAELEREFNVPQGSFLLRVTQNRISEKAHLREQGFPVVPYRVVDGRAELAAAAEELKYPVVLKSATGGYDGKGQAVLRSPADLGNVTISGLQVLEKFLTLTGEVSVVVARRRDGETAAFPVGENVHRHNILHTTVVPARLSQALQAQATELAIGIAESLGVVGLLAVEMFLTPEGIIVNELAPRPHNSGHYTLGACETSQFEQFVRAVCNLPLGPTTLLYPAVMVNILGEHMAGLMTQFATLPPNVKVHLYGKSGTPVPRRKMGHLLIRTDTPDQTTAWAEEVLV
ncbi:MAG: 5-(carboxyamino)imidazole ribonucleotide synthase [Selenomonadales bacterium]|nr:5-(carboxyamino)imidazole ribonucleotide synthase [Selenomonadales bacterium]